MSKITDFSFYQFLEKIRNRVLTRGNVVNIYIFDDLSNGILPILLRQYFVKMSGKNNLTYNVVKIIFQIMRENSQKKVVKVNANNFQLSLNLIFSPHRLTYFRKLTFLISVIFKENVSALVHL